MAGTFEFSDLIISFVRFRTQSVTTVDNSARSSGVLTKHGEGFGPGPRIRV